ncbi:MAG: hypothetical protein WCO99_14540, partial [Planctomycetota bacterium]
IDVLADFKPEATRGIGFRFFGHGDELAEIHGQQSTSAHDWPRVLSRPCAAKPSRFTKIHEPSYASSPPALRTDCRLEGSSIETIE